MSCSSCSCANTEQTCIREGKDRYFLQQGRNKYRIKKHTVIFLVLTDMTTTMSEWLLKIQWSLAISWLQANHNTFIREQVLLTNSSTIKNKIELVSLCFKQQSIMITTYGKSKCIHHRILSWYTILKNLFIHL